MTSHETRHPSDAFPPGTAWRFFVAYGALFIPFAVAAPHLQILLESQGFGEREIGLILGTGAVTAVFAPPILGFISDRTHCRRAVLAIAVACMVPSFLMFGVVTTLVPALVVSVVCGFFGRPLIPLTDGFVFRHIHLGGGDYGRVRIGGSITFIAMMGAMALLGVAREGGGRVILIAMVVAGALHLASILALPPDAAAAAPTVRTGPRGPGLRLFLARGFVMFAVAALLGRVAMTSYYHFFSLFAMRDLGYECPQLLWALGPVSEIPMIYFSTRAVKRIGVKALFALGLVGIAVRLGCFSMVTSVWQVVPLQFLHALTFGAYHTASVTYVSRLAPPDMRSSAQTVFHAVTLGLGGIVGGALGGEIAERFGFRTLYVLFAGVAVAALAVLVFLVPPDRRDADAGREAAPEAEEAPARR
ncbi:MAG: MFS transporter [Planctomycetota bacterium]|jgi:PPP family 3-phenylpropionic acid transporter